jgi:small GTP-binding protein
MLKYFNKYFHYNLFMEEIPRFNILFLGDHGTGKTSIIRRIVCNEFTHKYESTQSLDFYTKDIQIGDNCLSLQLWEANGQETVDTVYTKVMGAFIVVDATNPDSIRMVKKWKCFLNTKRKIPTIFLVNKIDLADFRDWLEPSDVSWFDDRYEVCAKDNTNINEALKKMIDLCHTEISPILVKIEKLEEKLLKEKHMPEKLQAEKVLAEEQEKKQKEKIAIFARNIFALHEKAENCVIFLTHLRDYFHRFWFWDIYEDHRQSFKEHMRFNKIVTQVQNMLNNKDRMNDDKTIAILDYINDFGMDQCS